jgi:hypothetical protein
MACRFENIPCAIRNGFSCKKCLHCGHSVSLPSKLAEQNWSAVIANIERNCTNPGLPPIPDVVPDSIPWQPLQPQQAAPAMQAVMAAHAPPSASTLPPPTTIEDLVAADQTDGNGPGAFLKKYLGKIGIHTTPDCSCNARAKHMDAMGNDWCEKNLDTIVGWLREEAEKRRLPFVDWPARMLVSRAIKTSRKARAAHLKTLNLADNPLS